MYLKGGWEIQDCDWRLGANDSGAVFFSEITGGFTWDGDGGKAGFIRVYVSCLCLVILHVFVLVLMGPGSERGSAVVEGPTIAALFSRQLS